MTIRTPIFEFKRALTSATKAISGEPEMEVSFCLYSSHNCAIDTCVNGV